MQAFELADLLEQHEATGDLYLEFLREPSMSCGLYRLPAGGADPQQPHGEDELYYVLNGRAHITVGGETRSVQSGSAIFVAAHAPHRFHDIEEDLTLLVFFAPPEGSQNPDAAPQPRT